GRGDGGGGGGGDGTVHPRVCGERCESVGPNTAPNGSSPRVRGEGLVALDSGGSCRFHPACAGRGRCALVPRSEPSVHPRVCGERGDIIVRALLSFGSSPRVRGEGPCAES